MNIANNPDDIEGRLRAAVVMKRVRIEEFFFDFDKLRRGKVTKNQFEQILSMLNFNLTAEEFNALAVKYKTTEDAEYMVNYKAFCASINAAFTTYGIQHDPLAKVAPVTVGHTVPARQRSKCGNARYYFHNKAAEPASSFNVPTEWATGTKISLRWVLGREVGLWHGFIAKVGGELGRRYDRSSDAKVTNLMRELATAAFDSLKSLRITILSGCGRWDA